MKIPQKISLIKGTVIATVFLIMLTIIVLQAKSHPDVVATDTLAVLYSDNTAEIIFRDEYQNEMHTYRGDIEPQYVGEDKKDWGWGPVGYVLPKITLQGGNDKRVVFSIEGAEERYCDTNIFYVDRINHTAHTAVTPLCIVKSFDEHDHTRFWSQKYFGYESTQEPYVNIGIGDYNDGHLIATTSITVPMWTDGESSDATYYIDPLSIVTDWEMTKVVFAFLSTPECGDYRGVCDTPAFIYLYDLETGEVRDVTPEKGVTFLTLYPWGDASGGVSMLQYIRPDPYIRTGHNDPASGKFLILEYGVGHDHPYAIIDTE